MTSSSRASTATDPILQACALCKGVDTRQGRLDILSGLDLSVNSGESLAIVGASGSGKSTLLGLLAGLDDLSAGEVYLAGQALSPLSEDERAALRSRRVGFVFQDFQLLPSLSARDNVSLPLELIQAPRARQQAQELLEAVGLGDRMDHSPRQLSGGEQQRVAIARAFACQPDILFADEPTGNLDLDSGEHIADLLFDLNRRHATTLVLVTHDHALAQRCDRRTRLQAGRLEVLS